MEEKVILLFSDLEGTILGEENIESKEKYKKETMQKFLAQIDRLQRLTGAEVHMHFVSPIYMEKMEEILEKIDDEIATYNKEHPDSKRLRMTECGGCLGRRKIDGSEDYGRKTIPLRMIMDSRNIDTSGNAKVNYVEGWHQIYKDRGRLMSIYCGNGSNDIAAMKFVQRSEGFTVCPANSPVAVKEIADFTSQRTELEGVVEGIENINKKIEERVAQKAEER